jgi:hypothetical protein
MSGLYYPATVEEVLFENVTLTGAFTGNAKSFTTKGFPKITLYCDYTAASGATTPKVQLQVEGSPNGTDWYIFQNDEVSGGTSILSSRVFEKSGTAATSVKFDLPLDIGDIYVRVSAKESVTGNAGTLSTSVIKMGR